MTKKKPSAKKLAEPIAPPVPIAPLSVVATSSLDDRVTELEGDLVRIVELLIMGDLESAKFRAILDKRQGKA